MKQKSAAVGSARSGPILILFLLVCGLALWAGNAVTRPAIPDWYATLNKPSWTPPDWAFAVVWPILFLLMALAGWRAWRGGRQWDRRKTAFALFGLQLALNVGWSALFFGLRSPLFALIAVVYLVPLIAATTVAFWRIDRIAGALLLPYLGWASFAAVLNAAIVVLNA